MDYCLVFLAVYFSTALSQNILTLSDSTTEISWSPTSKESVIIEANEGFKIKVNVTDLNLDSANGEFATISPDDTSDSSGLLFTYTLSRKPSYLFNTNTLYAEFSGTDSSNFTAIFSRVGEELTTTTTEIPTTPIILPTPSVNDSDQITVIIAGRRDIEYTVEIQNTFRNAVVAMATEYCEDNNFMLNGTITTDNVFIHKLMACGIDWPRYETCVKITFAVPVNLRDDIESPWAGYQLTTEHLEWMWSRLSLKYLPDGLTNYAAPDVDTWFHWQIGIFSACVIIFIICLLTIRHFTIKFSRVMRRRKLSDRASIISSTDRTSQMSLPPHYLQETPPLFENAYPMYNPESGTVYSDNLSYRKAMDYSSYNGVKLEKDKHDLLTDEEEVNDSGA